MKDLLGAVTRCVFGNGTCRESNPAEQLYFQYLAYINT